jgi:hypothetical protein
MLAGHLLDLAGDLLGLLVEPGRMEVLHGGVHVIDFRVELWRRSGTMPFTRATGQVALEFVEFALHFLGHLVTSGPAEFGQLARHRRDPLEFRMWTRTIPLTGATGQATVKLVDFVLDPFGLLVTSGPPQFL